MPRNSCVRTIGWLLLAIMTACAPDPVPAGLPGAALPELSREDSTAFETGRALFKHAFTTHEGLGPAFNEEECSACHDIPTLGGTGGDRVRKATRFENGRCSLLTEAGGDLLQNQTTPFLQQRGVTAEPIPARANGIGTISPPPLFGLGAVEAIREDAILKRADPNDANGDGISGRAGRAPDGRLGRFGRKASFATLREFIASALIGEMGITTSAFPREERIAGAELPAGADPHADPELSDSALAQLTRFVTLLAPPAGPELKVAARDSVLRGEEVFSAIGCVQCHTPRLPTGPNRVTALANRQMRLYSDLLLHDLGPDAASVCGTNAGPSEWRTAPLLGLRFRPFFMHQGQAHSLEQAVRLHGGEAETARLRFEALSPELKALVLRFLTAL
jgi:CxxC motif-containing protein (DUF1111 family)